MSQILTMAPDALLIYGLIFLVILYLTARFVGENKGKVFLGFLAITVLVVYFQPQLQEAGWFPTEFKGPFARAETLPPVIVPGEAIPAQPVPNQPNPAPNPKEQQLPAPQLNGDFKIAQSQSGCEVPSVWQRDGYYPESFQRAGCGPASVAMLLISQGFLDATKEAVKQLALDSYGDVWDNSGSNGVGALARLLNSQSEDKLNAKGRTNVSWDEVLNLVQEAPIITGIYSTEFPYYYPYGHYLVVLRIEDNFVIANDPYAPAGEDFERQFPLEKFKSYYEAAGSKLVEIDPVTCGVQENSEGDSAVLHGQRDRKWIALTFDADMTPKIQEKLRSGEVKSWYNQKIIEILNQTQTKTTLFLTGMWLAMMD